MAITVNLYSFTKRENSTKRPTGSGTSYSCTLLDETSLMNPTFKLSIAQNPIGKNYAYVPDFNRYYFVTDISSHQNFWYITCTCDVLASFKTEIGVQSHYVLRSASEYDGYISDNHYGAKVVQTATKLPSTGPLYWNTNSSFVVGINSVAFDDEYQVGSVVYYQMDSLGLNNFVKYLMQNLSSYCHITSAPYDDPGVQEALINPIQYIVSCVAIPVGFPSSYVSPTSIRFGYYSWAITGEGRYRILELGQTHEEGNLINIPKHPQAATRGKYLNGAPYTSYTFHLGPFGDIPLDPADLIDAENLRYKVLYDMCQGIGRLVVGPAIPDTDNIMNISYCGSAKVCADVQLAQAIINPLEAQLAWETGLNNTVATGVSGGVGGGTLSNLFRAQNKLQETYVDAVKNKFPTCCGKGTPGSFLNFKDSDYGCYLEAKFMNIVDENLAEIGRPLCQTKRLDTLSGYILCEKADAAITGIQDEAIKINEYLNSGFFYE